MLKQFFAKQGQINDSVDDPVVEDVLDKQGLAAENLDIRDREELQHDLKDQGSTGFVLSDDEDELETSEDAE